MIVHGGGQGALLRGELEHPRPLELLRPQELAQLLKLRLALAGQAADQGGADHHVGDGGTELGEQRLDLRPGAAAAHGLQDAVIGVLDGNVQIVDDLLFPGNDLDQLVRHRLRIEVVEPDPVEI